MQTYKIDGESQREKVISRGFQCPEKGKAEAKAQEEEIGRR